MQKKVVLFQILYYLLVLLIYMGCMYFAYWTIESMNQQQELGLGTIVGISFGLLFLATPCYIAITMRFSLLKWYVDPIAAAIVPLYTYGGMILNVMDRTKNLFNAIHRVNFNLSNDGGEGWYFLGGLFLFGLLTSFSIARKKGNSISYQLLTRITPSEKGLVDTQDACC